MQELKNIMQSVINQSTEYYNSIQFINDMDLIISDIFREEDGESLFQSLQLNQKKFNRLVLLSLLEPLHRYYFYKANGKFTDSVYRYNKNNGYVYMDIYVKDIRVFYLFDMIINLKEKVTK